MNLPRIPRLSRRATIIAWSVCLALAFLLGWVGFATQTLPNQQRSTPLDAAYRSLQLFFLNGGDLPDPNLAIQIARWLSPLLIAGGLVRWIRNLLDPRRILPFSDHVVIVGLGTMGRRFAERLRNDGNTVVIIEKSPTNPHAAACQDRAMHVLFGDAVSMEMLERANVKDAKLVLCLAPDEINVQVRQGLKALVTARTREFQSGPLRCYMHLTDETLLVRERLEAYRASCPRYAEAMPRFQPLSVDVFNMYELTARLELDEKAHRFLGPEIIVPKVSRVVLFGFDGWNQGVVVEASKRWMRTKAWQSGKKLTAAVVVDDPSAAPPWKAFVAKRKSLEDICEFETWSVADVPARLDAQSLAVVCLARDAATLGTGTDILAKVGTLPCSMILTIREPWIPDPSLIPASPGTSAFAVQDRACAMANLSETFDAIGRTIHEQYLRDQVAAGVKMGSKPAMAFWDKLDSVLKSSNRGQAAGMEENLKKSGYRLTAMKSLGEPYRDIDKDDVEEIAKREHERFVRERQSMGEPAAPWDHVDPATQEIARNQIRAWPWILAQQGFALNK